MKTVIKKGPCCFCEKTVSSDFYCYGCREYVCKDCDVSMGNTPMGSHEPDDHLVEMED